MRNLCAVLALATLAPASLEAQRAWSPEIGIQGGVSRVKPTGTGLSDHVDQWDLPGFAGAPGSGGLFAVIPLSARFAFEPTLAAAEYSFAFSVSAATLGLRWDYAVSSHVYAAAGGTVAYLSFPAPFTGNSTHETQLGLQAALGYRLRLSGRLNGRLEALAATFRKTEQIPPSNVYAVRFGLSARLK